jgi:hypothetical protein
MPAKTEGERYMRAYFHTFTPTGDDKVDAILEAVALAGKAFHHTMDWSEAEEYGPAGYWDLIQQRANEAARAPDAAPAGEPAAEQKATLKITLEWDDDDGPLEIVAHGTLRDMHYLDARLKFLHSLERATPPRGEADERAMFEKWARERYAVTDHSFVRAPDGYAHTIGHRALGMTYASVQMLWEAWRDRAAVASVGTPPAQEQKPLTVEHIERLWDKFMSAAGSGYVPDFVRAIEAAHGIGASLPVGGEGETADKENGNG